MKRRRYATTPRVPPQVFLIVDNADHEVTRLPHFGKAAAFAARLDETQPEGAPHWVVAFRDLRRSVA